MNRRTVVHKTGNVAGKGRAMRRRGYRGFSLIEMLTAVAIVALLAGLLLTALGAARRAAKKGRAKSDIDQIKTAWSSFQEEYRRFPESVQISNMNATAIAILRGAATQPALTENPKKITFMDFRGVTTYYCDPWGSHNTTAGVYRVALDMDYDNKVTVNGEELFVSVAVWSLGPDKAEFTQDDLVSWRR